MKKKIFLACAALVVSAAAVVGVKAYNYYSMPELMRANLEALSQNEEGDLFYKVAKYDICKLFLVTSVDGNIGTGIEIGALLTKAEVKATVQGSITVEPVDCHKRYCCRTTEMQSIECIPGDKDWVMCHSECRHSNNQI